MSRFTTVGQPHLTYTPGVFCPNWDSLKTEYITHQRTGATMGQLMPRISLAILRASPGIGSHSIPKTDTRTRIST